MWIDSMGGANTVAHPDPGACFDSRFLQLLRRKHRAVSEEFIDGIQRQIVMECQEEPNRIRIMADQSLMQSEFPRTYKIGTDIGVTHRGIRPLIRQALDNLPLEWRLDAADLIEDIVDDC